jgi:LuxR family maltose regulon positive regulatory protein
MTATHEPETTTLVLTKTLVPPHRIGFVHRSDLVDRLADDVDRKLVLVPAPAGYGKTTLLTQWAHQESERRFAWLSLSAAENDPVMLWRYIFASLRRVVPGLAEQPWSNLSGSAPDLDGMVIPGMLNALLEVAGRIVLVLDDYHVVDNPTCHESIQFFVDHLPRSTQLVLATRSVPPLMLSSLVAQRQILEIDRTDLAFDKHETAQALAFATPVSAEDANGVFDNTEGWPVGVYLAGEALRHAGSEEGVRGAVGVRPLERYLTDEMLSALASEDRDFLASTSILEELSGDLCDHVIGGAGSAARLSAAARSNLLVSPIDASGEWYRCHAVLREALLRVLHAEAPDDLTLLHRRAHQWFLDHGDVSRAITHAMEAGDHRIAADLIYLHYFEYWATGRLETAHRWLNALPESVIEDYPPLLIAAAWISAFLGDASEMRRYAEAASNAEYLEPMPDGTTYAALLVALRANLWLDGVTEWLPPAEVAYEAEAPGTPSRRLAAVHLGCARVATGDFDGGQAVWEEAVAATDVPDAFSTYTAGQLALLEVLRGRWVEAEELAAQARETIESQGLEHVLTSAAAYVAAAVTAARARRVVEAQQYLRTATPLAHVYSIGLPFDGLEVHTFAAEAQLLMGDVVAARSHARKAAEYLEVLGDGGVFAARLEQVTADIESRPPEDSAEPEEGPESLTTRERQILALLDSELSLRDIGHELYVSRNTAKTHVARIYRKLGVSSRAGAVTRARELDLV